MATIQQPRTLDDRQAPTNAARPPLLSETYVPQTMPSILGTFDLTAMFVCALFLLPNAIIGASRGLVSLTYLVLSCIVFFVPSLLATAQLGTRFPFEGSVYTWTYQVLGSSWSRFLGQCTWLTGMLAAITCAHTFVLLLQGLHLAWVSEPWQQGVVMLVIIGVASLIGLQRARTTHYVINALFLLTLLAVLLVGVSTAVWLAHGHGSLTDFRRSSDWLIRPDNFSVFGITTLAFLGVFLPLNMAGEIRSTSKQAERRIITRHLLWGSIIVLACSLVITFAVLVVQGPTMLTTAMLPFETFTIVHVALGSVASDIAVMCFEASCLAAAIVFTAASARILMVLSIDGHTSLRYAKLNRHRIPSQAMVFQMVFVAGYVIILFIGAPSLSILEGNAGTRLFEIHTLNAAVMTVIWAMVTLFLFVMVLLLLRRHRLKVSQQRRFPMPLLWGSALVGPAACVALIGSVLFYSWIPQLIGNSRWLWLVGGLTCVYLGGVFLWNLSHHNLERDE